MRKLLAVSLLAASACGGAQNFQDQARDAMPSSSSVRMGNPGESQQQTSTGSTGQTQQNLAGASDWYNATAAFVFSVNFATGWTLGVVEAVTNLPPTSCSESSCVWGPGSNALDPNVYRLTVSTKDEGKTFHWNLDAQAKSKPASSFVTVISGDATPSGIRHRGSGTFTIDQDAAATLDGRSTDHGTITIEYSNVGPAHIVARFKNIDDKSPKNVGQRGNAYYDFRELVSGGGDMEIAWHNLSTDERADIHSRWLANGSGRADVTVLASTGNGSLSNCWATAAAGFTTVFDSSVQVGTETACSISPAVPGTRLNEPQ
jgi:hypothetical protein